MDRCNAHGDIIPTIREFRESSYQFVFDPTSLWPLRIWQPWFRSVVAMFVSTTIIISLCILQFYSVRSPAHIRTHHTHADAGHPKTPPRRDCQCACASWPGSVCVCVSQRLSSISHSYVYCDVPLDQQSNRFSSVRVRTAVRRHRLTFPVAPFLRA